MIEVVAGHVMTSIMSYGCFPSSSIISILKSVVMRLRVVLRFGWLLLTSANLLLAGNVRFVFAQEEESPLMKRFFSEAPRAWERQKDFYMTLDGTSESRRRNRIDGGESGKAY